MSSRCAKDTVLPLSSPLRLRDGSLTSEIPLEKGTFVFINYQAVNVNKATWGEDALEWKPERWLTPLPHTVDQAHIPGIYANLMTFLGGSHACMCVLLLYCVTEN